MAHALDKDGYHEVCLHAGGRRQRVKVHKVVALSFIGEPPEGKPFVLHRDDDKDNNYWTNLYYGDGSDNQRDAVDNGSNYNANKTHCDPGNHPLSGDNLYMDDDGHRHCRACWKDRREHTG